MSESYCHICNKPYRIIGLKSKMAEWCACKERISALASEQYRKALCEAVESRIAANRAKVRYQATQALWEAQRTVEATSRAAMRSAT